MAHAEREVVITYIGHGTFHFLTPEGRGVLVDAWVDGNPACPAEMKARVREQLAVIFVTHAHHDHVGDIGALARDTGAMVACQVDLKPYLEHLGVPAAQIIGYNKGGTVHIADVAATMTTAVHSTTATVDGHMITPGSEAGYVLRFSNGFTVYHAGDTAVTMDMQLVGALYRPDVAIVPIGDHYTMGPRQAAYALKLIGAPRAIPSHYATFPLLRGTPAELEVFCREFAVETTVVALKPGETVR